jgi:PAS domain S-box-containing protein
MSRGNARQEVRPQTIETTLPILIDSAALGKKDCLHILHVDDDVNLLEISKQILSMDNNFEIDTVSSVDEAFARMEKQNFDVVVSDYEMPLKNGLDFLKELREQKRDISFILFTGKGREEVVVKALNLGADSYINKNGSPETVYCELADAINKTVERKKSRRLLVESESKYRMLVEKSLQGIMIAQGAPPRVAFANAAIGKMLGYSFEEFTSLSPAEVAALIYHEDRTTFFNRFTNRLAGNQADNSHEFRAVRKDGSIIWMEAFATRIEYDGQPAVQAMFLDINDRKKAEETLRKSEMRYRELANFLPEIVFEADLTGKVTFFSQRASEITGFTREELEEGLNMLSFVVPEERERAKENIKKSLAGEDLGANEYMLFRKNGTTYPAIVRTNPIISENKVTGLRGLVIYITERKKTEQEFRDLAKFPSENPNPVLRVSKDNLILYANQASNALLKGLNVEIGQPPPHFLNRPIATALTSGFRQEAKCEHNQRTFLFMIAPVKDASYVNVYGLDITERLKTEKALQESEEKLRMIFEGASDGILVADSKTKSFVFANPRICEITGYSLKELL